MKAAIHFLKLNRLRIVVWLLALVATVPASLKSGSLLWHSLDDLFNPISLWGQVIQLGCTGLITVIVFFAMQSLVKVAVKKFVPTV